MTAKFEKLNKFEGNDFRRWQKKMHFLLTTLKVAYVLSTPMLEFVENETQEQIRKRCKWENDDYIYRGHILNGMSDAMFDVYRNVGSAKELWDQLESNYMVEDAYSKKFLASNFNNYKMVDSRSVMEQYHELLRIVGKFTHHGLSMDESISMSSIIDKLSPSWKDFKHTLKHNKDELSLVQLESHFRIKESLREEESGKGKGKEIASSSSVNMIEDGKNKNNNKNSKGKKMKNDGNNDGSKDVDSSIWHASLRHVHYKRMLAMSKDNLIPEFDITLEKCNTCMLTKITIQPFKDTKRDYNILELIHSDLCDFHATPSLGNKKYVATFIDDASIIFYVYLCHAKDEALDKFKIYKTKVELQQNDLIKTLRTDRGGEYYDPVYFQSVGIIHETTAPYTPQQNGVSERKNRALKEIVNSMLSYSGLSEGFWGKAMLTTCYLLNRVPNKRNKVTPWELCIKEDPRTSDEAIDPQMDVKTTFLNGDLEEKVYMKQPEGFIMPENKHKFDKFVYCKFDKSDKGVIVCLYVDYMLIFGTDQFQMDKMKEFLSSNFSIKDIGEADVILGIRIKHEVKHSFDLTIKLMPNTDIDVDQLEYFREIGCLMYAMTSTRPDIVYVIVLEGYSDASWITNSEDQTSTTGWVFLLGGGAILWASKKQTCITDLTIEAQYVALAAAGKEAEWLRNLIYEIPVWQKPISPISNLCDSATTLAKAYCQIYNEKSRHLGVRHSMVRELITNGVISGDFVRSQQNLADHLTKGLAKYLVNKSAIGMELKSIQISNGETPNSLLANAGS
ncbi:zinc finger, CCHC-type containing protein [Tanacetum coccineum]